jgi:hypothetical protein
MITSCYVGDKHNGIILCDDCARGVPLSPACTCSISDYVKRQRDWSEKTFGHSVRTMGITKHIEKEIAEIRAAPHDLMEWVDVIILALDGAWRAGYTPEQIQEAMERKQAVNFARQWPPAVDCDPDQPSEHVKSNTPRDGSQDTVGADVGTKTEKGG